MRITVFLLTRNRPAGLIAAVRSLDTLSTGQNPISYIVRYDADDQASLPAFDILRGSGVDIAFVPGDRPATHGEAWNQALRAAGDFDAGCVISDDVIPLCPRWDEGVRIFVGERGYHAFAWKDLNYPNLVTHPIFSRAWAEAAGVIFPEFFPFWFSDTWMAQVYELALGQPMPIAGEMMLGGKAGGRTGNLRDFRFWVDFWIATRVLRLEEAETIRARLGWAKVDVAPILAKFARLDEQWDVAAIERVRGDPSPPNARYLLAKERAERWLRARS